MNLWIRSQKREGLFNFDRLWYYYDEEENKHCICNYEFEFGTYKSKERALEVLDEIQRYISLKGLLNYNHKETTEILYDTIGEEQSSREVLKSVVYEMPKE